MVVDGSENRLTLASTLLQGAQAQRHSATGIRFWIKAREGKGTVTCGFYSNAFSTNERVVTWGNAAGVHQEWQPIALPFANMGTIPLRDVDLFTLRFESTSGAEFLIDDVELLGGWNGADALDSGQVNR